MQSSIVTEGLSIPNRLVCQTGLTVVLILGGIAAKDKTLPDTRQAPRLVCPDSRDNWKNVIFTRKLELLRVLSSPLGMFNELLASPRCIQSVPAVSRAMTGKPNPGHAVVQCDRWKPKVGIRTNSYLL